MNTFQVVTIVGLLATLVWECVQFGRGNRSGARLLRIGVWTTASAAIVRPDLPQKVALMLGIGRGADVVLYVFVLAFIATSFYFYSRCSALQRDLTKLVRQQAIEQAQRCGDSVEGCCLRKDVGRNELRSGDGRERKLAALDECPDVQV